ncbi:copper transporter [soil metagenome]
MISFRFHIISLVSMFLALALGVVVGSTYVDRAIVDSLRNRIDTVSGNLDERLVDLERLSSSVQRLEDYARDSAPFAVGARLVDTPVVVVAERGVDDGQAEQLVLLLAQAGAVAPGVLWFESKWSLSAEADRIQLADALSLTTTTPDGERAAAWRAVVDELVSPPSDSPPPPSALATLIDMGFLTFQAVGSTDDTVTGLVGTGPRVLYVSRERSDVAVDDLVTRMTEILVANNVLTVVAEVGPDDTDAERLTEPDTVTEQVRSIPRLRAAVATVDHARLEQGKVASVLALSELSTGVVGHYGYAASADRVIPEWVSP